MNSMTHSQIYFSNQIEWLLLPLRQQFRLSSPLTRRLVIVPSPAMKSWLTFQIAKEDGIAMGLETTYLDQGIQTLYKFFNQESCQLRLPNVMELTLAIEWEIRQILKQECTPIWDPLFHYLKVTPHTSLTPKSEKRLISLAEKLAKLFLEYGLSGGKAIQPWILEGSCWQSALWQRIFEEDNPYQWTYPYKALNNLSFNTTHPNVLQVHVFAMSYLPALYHHFLQNVSQVIPVSFYLLSPCEAFWSDICSDKESQRLQEYWNETAVSDNQKIALEEFLRDRNPLLANFGRIGREMAKAIEENHPQVDAQYIVPENISHVADYESYIHPDFIFQKRKSATLTLLEAIQADITLLRNPETAPPLVLAAEDLSIQIHQAASIRREVQILYDRILHLIHTQADSQIDWIVMAPDIRTYAPFIKMIFGAPDSPLDYLIMESDLPQQNPYIQAFISLLQLSVSRWDTLSVFNLLDAAPFRKKVPFDYEEMEQIRNWMQETGVRWGLDGRHRQNIFQQKYKDSQIQPQLGTWENSFRYLLSSLACEEEDRPQVEMSQAPLLGKWIRIIRSLYTHLKPLNDGTVKSLSEWIDYLKELAALYLVSETEEDQELFEIHLGHFQNLSASVQTHSFAFDSIYSLLETSFQKGRVSYKETSPQTVRFCSLLPMRAIPAKGIALLGMQEGAFPRYYPDSSLHAFAFHPQADYAPTQIDFDRYLFLETLISAREYFLMSYQGYSIEGKEQPPSILIQELLTYMDKHYRLHTALPSTVCHYAHPFHAYDSTHFHSKSTHPSYSISHYRLAAAQKGLKQPPHFFIPTFSPEMASSLAEQTIDIKHLISLARNPLENYFNRQLGIYLEKLEKRKILHEDCFSIPFLTKHLLKKEALKFPLEKLFAKAELKGELPHGYFRPIISEQLIDEIEQIKSPLLLSGIALEAIFQIELSDSATTPAQIHPNCWSIPPLKIQMKSGESIKLIGTLSDVTPQGLLAYIKDDKKEVVKAWPGYLLLNCIVKTYPDLFNNRLIFGKSGSIREPFFEDPFEEMQKYLEYYFLSQTSPSPLLPEWIPEIIENPEECQSKMQKSLVGPYALHNDYMQWITQGENHLDYEKMSQAWQASASTYFGAIFANWYPSRRKGGADV